MDFEDPLDLAICAFLRVADMASNLGVMRMQPIYGSLGAELLLVAEYLDNSDAESEQKTRIRLSKLLNDVETICSVSCRLP